jgi:hypothetical protein
MARMTNEEADALDDLLTRTTPELEVGKGGFFTRQRDLLKVLDDTTADYILTRAEASNKLPAQIIGDLVRKELKR